MISTCTAEFVLDIRGLSSDTKPNKTSFAPLGHAPANGSTFIEMDTGKVFIFDDAGNQWKEI